MTDQFPTSPQTPMHPIEKLWRELDLPEWFLGNGGSNTKLYALYDAIRAALSAQTGEPDFDGWPIEALEEIERMRAAIERGEYTELPPLGDSRRRAKTPQPDTAPSLTLAEQAIERQRVLGDPLSHVDALATELVNAGESEYTAPSPLSTGEVSDLPQTLGIAGPCVICGATNYALSWGGSTICPKCDCGQFDAATVMQQAKVIVQLREELAALSEPPVTEQIRREALEEAQRALEEILSRAKDRGTDYGQHLAALEAIKQRAFSALHVHPLRPERALLQTESKT